MLGQISGAFRISNGTEIGKTAEEGNIVDLSDNGDAAIAYKSDKTKEKSAVENGSTDVNDVTGGCGHGTMFRSVQKSQLLIEQTEEFVSHLFDAGHLTEATRLAVTLRVLLTPRPQRILLTIDLSEVSGVSDGGEFIRVRRRVLRPEDGSFPGETDLQFGKPIGDPRGRA